MGRVGTVVGGAAGGFVLEDFGPRGFFIALALPLLAAGVAALAVRRSDASPR
jgi:AAHS family 4-hydroxybenzoate transporter-like MFS transporter